MVSPGGLSPFKRNKTRPRGLPRLRRTFFLGLTTFSFGRPCFPLSSSCPRGCCLPVLLPAGYSLGGLMHSCGGVWALSLPLPFGLGLLGSCLLAFFLCMFCLSLSIRVVGSTGAFVGSVPFPPRLCAAMGQGAWSFPLSVFGPGRLRVLPLPSVSVVGGFLLEPPLWRGFSGPLTLLCAVVLAL